MEGVDFARESADDAAEIEAMLDLAFGPDRLAKTAYRLREGVEPTRELCLVAREAGILRASLRFWPIEIGDDRLPGLLLGPLAVDPAHRGRGIGIEIMRRCLALAREMAFTCVILVGDEPYYARVGFSRAKAVGLSMPGPVDERRLLGLELVPGALDGVTGPIQRPGLPEKRATSAALAGPGQD